MKTVLVRWQLRFGWFTFKTLLNSWIFTSTSAVMLHCKSNCWSDQSSKKEKVDWNQFYLEDNYDLMLTFKTLLSSWIFTSTSTVQSCYITKAIVKVIKVAIKKLKKKKIDWKTVLFRRQLQFRFLPLKTCLNSWMLGYHNYFFYLNLPLALIKMSPNAHVNSAKNPEFFSPVIYFLFSL